MVTKQQLEEWIKILPKEIQEQLSKTCEISILSGDSSYTVRRSKRSKHFKMILSDKASKFAFFHEVGHVLKFGCSEQEANNFSKEYFWKMRPQKLRGKIEDLF